MKKAPDEGLKYIFELGLERIRSTSEYTRFLKSKIGDEKGNELIKLISDRADKHSKSFTDDRFYSLKNESLETALAVESCFNTDYIRKVANWIFEHNELFGDTIADIGCDTGVITCFIAKCFPDAHVVGIDRGESGIAVARKLAEKLGLHNIEFKAETVAEDTGSYQTVFSSKTIHENLDKDGFYERKLCEAFGFTDHAHLFDESADRYFSEIKRLLCPSGNFISIEWPHGNSFALYMLYALNRIDLAPQKDYLGEIKTENCGDITTLSVTVATLSKSFPESEINPMFFDRYFPESFVGVKRYSAWKSQLLLYVKEKFYHERKINFITGVHLYSQEGRYGRISFWEDASDSSIHYVEYIQNEPEDFFGKIPEADYELMKAQIEETPKGKGVSGPFAISFQVLNGKEIEQ